MSKLRNSVVSWIRFLQKILLEHRSVERRTDLIGVVSLSSANAMWCPKSSG